MTNDRVEEIQHYFERLFQEGIMPWTEHGLEPAIPQFADLLLREQQESRLLDIGCGNGWVSLYFGSRRLRVTGIDSSSTAIDQARRAVQEAKLQDRVTFDVGNGLELPYETASFEAVFDRGFFHHVLEEYYAQYLSEVTRVLVPQGKLSLHAFSRRNREGIGHRFEVEDIKRIFGEQFVVLEHSFDPWPTSAPAHLGHYLLQKKQ